MKRWLPGAVVALFALALPAAAQASGSCLTDVDPWDPPDDPTTVVFVGTVQTTQTYEQNALMHVEEVWYGGPVPEYLAAIQAEPNTMYSTSIHFRHGDRYVVRGQRDGDLVHTSSCDTHAYDEATAAKAPPITDPIPAPRPSSWGVEGPSWMSALPLLAVILFPVFAWVAVVRLGRRRPTAGPG